VRLWPFTGCRRIIGLELDKSQCLVKEKEKYMTDEQTFWANGIKSLEAHPGLPKASQSSKSDLAALVYIRTRKSVVNMILYEHKDGATRWALTIYSRTAT
jgi:hypothetical protein